MMCGDVNGHMINSLNEQRLVQFLIDIPLLNVPCIYLSILLSLYLSTYRYTPLKKSICILLIVMLIVSIAPILTKTTNQ